MNIPNAITFGRLLIAVAGFVLMFLDMWIAAFGFLLISILMDVLDGKVARKVNQVTNQGIFLDVMVDKIVIIATYIVIGVKLNSLFLYLGLLMLLREYTMDTMRSIAASRNKVIMADKFSKIKGVLFMLAMIVVIANHAFLGFNYYLEMSMNIIATLAMVMAYLTLGRFFIKYKELFI
jgi:CDP-diacylglycerol---glycerol-3-phosphate 3-phosphatidyltransferase